MNIKEIIELFPALLTDYVFTLISIIRHPGEVFFEPVYSASHKIKAFSGRLFLFVLASIMIGIALQLSVPGWNGSSDYLRIIIWMVSHWLVFATLIWIFVRIDDFITTTSYILQILSAQYVATNFLTFVLGILITGISELHVFLISQAPELAVLWNNPILFYYPFQFFFLYMVLPFSLLHVGNRYVFRGRRMLMLRSLKYVAVIILIFGWTSYGLVFSSVTNTVLYPPFPTTTRTPIIVSPSPTNTPTPTFTNTPSSIQTNTPTPTLTATRIITPSP
jgi:hypothetical protein